MSTSSVELLDGDSWIRDSRVIVPRVRGGYPCVVYSILLVVGASLAAVLLLAVSRTPIATGIDHRLLWEDNERLDRVSRLLHDAVSPSRLLDNIHWLAEGMHVAGTKENFHLMARVADEYSRLGFHVQFFNYSVLLNYPDYSRPNTLDVLDERQKEWRKVSLGFGHPRVPTDEAPDVRAGVWWSAYSGNGTVFGRITYANYGFRQDFEHLEKMGIQVSGCIVLMRFGGVPRAVKVAEAELRGALGVVLFSDPLHTMGNVPNKTFPGDMSLPGDDVQRGGLLRTVGDPETPGLPSLPLVPRESVHKLKEKGIIPKIPVTPIGYDDAGKIMRLLDGRHIEEERWMGGLSADYRYSGRRLFRLSVHSHLSRRPISNVVATWRGREEPDRWVMMGNHVDAWVNGAIDPATGTSTLLEVARVMSRALSEHPPRRTLVFCHWDAEEFGMIGSTEFVEQMESVLRVRAVSMINVDHIAGNATLQVKSVPLLYRTITEAAGRISQTDEKERQEGRTTLLSTWKYYGNRSPIDGDRSLPEIGLPGGSSDHQRFISYAGVPSADLKMSNTRRSSYALYHSMHEVPWTVEHLLSPGGESFASIARLWAEAAHRLASSLVIPFGPLDYAQSLSQWLSRVHLRLDHMGLSTQLPSFDARFRALFASVDRFRALSSTLDAIVTDVNTGNRGISMASLARVNERMMNLERMFLDPHAFPGSLHRHLIFSPSRHAPSRSPFSLLLDSAFDWQLAATQSEKDAHLNKLAIAFARVTLAIDAASELLRMDDE